MSRIARVRAALVLVVTLVLGVAVAPGVTSAATPTPYGVNLVKNPGAEQAPSGSNQLPHWSLLPSFARVKYPPDGDTSGFPTQSEAARIHGGKHFFACGQDTASAAATQQISLHGRATDINAGRVRVTVTVQVMTYPDGDQAFVTLEAAGSSNVNHPLTTSEIVTKPNGRFQEVTQTAEIPHGTINLTMDLSGVRNANTYCDAYFDNVSVVLTRMSATPLDANVLQNPGAEQMPTAHQAAPSWIPDRAMEARYGAKAGYPSTAASSAIGGGKRFFTCQTGESQGILTQDRTIYGRTAQTNAGALKAVVTLRLGTRGGTDADFVVLFEDAWGHALTTRVEHYVTAPGMKLEKRTYPVPPGAEILEVYIQMDSPSSAVPCRAYVDNVSVKLTPA